MNTSLPRSALSLLAALALLAAAPAPSLAFSLADQPTRRPSSPPTPTTQPDDDDDGRPAKPAPRGKVDLRPKFKQGQQIRYTMEIDSVNDVKSPQVPELEQKQEMRQEITLLMRVVEVGTDSSTIELVYERVKVSVESDGATAKYDSGAPAGNGPKSRRPSKRKPDPKPAQTPPADPLSPGGAGGMNDDTLASAMSGIAGTVVTIEIDTAGNILSVSGAGSLNAGGAVGAIGGQGGGSWLVSSPGQDGFANVGDTWSTTSSLGATALGDFTMVTNYTLRSAAGGTAKINISGGIDSAASQAPGGGGAQIKDARYTGSYVWDTELGQLREMKTNQSATIDGGAMGVPMTIRTSSDVTVKKTR